MRFSTTMSALFVLMGSFVSAKLHPQGLCVDSEGLDTYIYNDAATRAMCESYSYRDRGNNQWDHCPDCTMTVISNLPLCVSPGWHMGGDEIEYYCKKHGAWGSLA